MTSPPPASDPRDDTPAAIIPPYQTPSPNQSIELYRGPMLVSQASATAHGDGLLVLNWLPSPRLEFSLDLPDFSTPIEDGQAILTLPQRSASAQILVTSHNYGWSKSSVHSYHRIGGIVSDRLAIDAGRRLTSLVFHLTNFPGYLGSRIRNSAQGWHGRATLSAANWRITLDSVPKLSDLERTLSAAGGYAITHVGRLERADASLFSLPEASAMLELLTHFFSFAAGRWSAVLLPVGFDTDGARQAEAWYSSKISPVGFSDSWLDAHHPEALVGTFPGFFSWWHDPIWAPSAPGAIHWYVESNVSAGSLDSSIILAQIDLELLSWIHFVEHTHTHSSSAFNPLPAETKIRQLLTWVGLPLDIPSALSSLTSFTAGPSPLDGPAALALIRNALVHPRRRASLPDRETRYDAHQLGLWYLELSLLRLFDYHGVYNNRLRPDRATGLVDPVPWASP